MIISERTFDAITQYSNNANEGRVCLRCLCIPSLQAIPDCLKCGERLFTIAELVKGVEEGRVKLLAKTGFMCQE